MKGRCDRVQEQLPRLVDGTLPSWRRRLVERHVARCDECSAELERQRVVAAGLGELRAHEDSVADDIAPPEGLLESLLEQAHEPGLRARAAVPVRGAISGARPGLSVAMALTLLALMTLAGWAGWRLGTALAERATRRRAASGG